MRVLALVATLAAASPATADTLREAFDRAWARQPEAHASSAREAEASARVAGAGDWLPGPPALFLSHRGDRLTEDNGQQEWDAGVALPLWLPGQRSARLGLAEEERAALAADLERRRLALAGEVRQRIWALAAAEAELAAGRARLEAATRLEQDIARRVQAGERARADLLLAREETLSARSELLEMAARAEEAREAWRLLTGTARAPDDAAEAPREQPRERHPDLEVARAAVAVAQARARLSHEATRDAPELTLGARRERDNSGTPWVTSLKVELRVPFATDARNVPVQSGAEASRAAAEAEYRLAHARIEADRAQGLRDRETARGRLELARERESIAVEGLRLVEKAFDLGERDLPGLLRARAAAREAGLALGRAMVAEGRARAMLNQSAGVLP